LFGTKCTLLASAAGYSVGKIDVFWKTFDKVRGKIVKIKIFEKLEHITHFG